MGKEYPGIGPSIEQWLSQQRVFFVATAPSATDGLINLSPKGMDTLRVVDDRTIVYLDYSGSGAETIAHLRENGRMVIMLCAFEGPPKIFRFYGKGFVHPPTDPRFVDLAAHFDQSFEAVRSIIRLQVERVADSCGYMVPLMDFKEERQSGANYIDNVGDKAIAEYRVENNLTSLDGLPALTADEASALATAVLGVHPEKSGLD